MNREDKKLLKRLDEVSEVLLQEKYQLTDIGLTSKLAFDWEKNGLLPKPRRSKFRRKYNGIEYVWLRLVYELRDFGLGISAIQNLMDFLFKPYDLSTHIAEIFDSEEEEEMKLFLSEINGILRTKEEMIDDIRTADIGLLNTIFGLLLFTECITDSDTHILIKKSGECVVFENPMSDKFVSSNILGQPYIAFPIQYALSELIDREFLFGIEGFSELTKLNTEERRVLELIRLGDISSLTVQFKNNQINLIETEEEVDLKEVNGKLVDLIKKDGYQEIQYKTQGGKIVVLKRKTKHRIY